MRETVECREPAASLEEKSAQMTQTTSPSAEQAVPTGTDEPESGSRYFSPRAGLKRPREVCASVIV